MIGLRTKSSWTLVLVSCCLGVLSAGCPTENVQTSGSSPGAALSNTGSNTPIPGSSPTGSSSGATVSIVNVILTSSSTGGTTPSPTPTPTPTPSATSSSTTTATTAQIYFDSSRSDQPTLNTVCNILTTSSGSSEAKPCTCRFRWTEVNASGAGYTRTVDTAIDTVQPRGVACPLPTVWDTEIPSGTEIFVSIKPNSTKGNRSGFRSNEYRFAKQSASQSGGDFRDAEGKAIKDIKHFVCFDFYTKGMRITHKKQPGTPRQSVSPTPSTPALATPPDVPIANAFQATNADVSAQSYWYDFYLRDLDEGMTNPSIVSGGAGFICPKVVRYEKSLSSTTATAVTKFYPGDSTFALALQQSRNYTVEVQANTLLASDSSSSGSSTTNTGNILGYAAKPSSDGTCPAFADSSGALRRTFRLRRYLVTYPRRFNTDGTPLDINQKQSINIIYVLDRPVDKQGADPLKPLTRLGPKPCPGGFQTTWPVFPTSGAGPTTVNALNSHVCNVGTSKLPHSLNPAAGPAAGSQTPSAGGYANSYDVGFLYGIPDGKAYGLALSRGAFLSGSNRTYCMPNGLSGGAQYYDNTTETCMPSSSSSPRANIDEDFSTPRNLDNIAILPEAIPSTAACPIYPPPAANLTTRGALNIAPMKGFVPEFVEDVRFQACAFQPQSPQDPDLVVTYNGYQRSSFPGDPSSADPGTARAFYCARTYPDPAWMVIDSGGSLPTKVPGHCDSGRPRALVTPPLARIPKTGSEGLGGFASLSSTPASRTVQDAAITGYAIMNERAYSCAFTYNPQMKKVYTSSAPLSDLTTPRSGCCQRCVGSSKNGDCSLEAPLNTPENRGIHSLVTAVGPWYNRYGKPAFTMQSILLSAAPWRTVPNLGQLDTASSCYTAATNKLTSTCSSRGTAIVFGSKAGGDWASESDGTPLGCFDPSEDP